MKIAMLTMEKFDNRRENSVGSSRIRGKWMMKYCPQITEFKNGFDYDAVIYQKAYYQEHMKRFQGVKIFDLCDPDWLEPRPITETAEHVDAFTVTTDKIKDFLTQITPKPVVVIPDRIDPEEHTPTKQEHFGKIRSVVWFGYSSNQVVLDQVVNILQNYQISLVVISERNYPQADVNIPYDYKTVHEEIIKHDAVLMPIFIKNLRHSYKSDNKILTSWALKMPVIREPQDIERLMNPAVRNAEAEKHYQYVKDEYHVKHSGPEYVNLIEQLMREKSA